MTDVDVSRARSVPVPLGMLHLPVCPVRGVPVPWFVAWVEGKPEWRMAEGGKGDLAVEEGLCWVCGKKLSRPSTFVLGPMCVLNRTTAEPPCHPECAEYSARACPFLSRPRLDRRNLPEPLAAAAKAAPGNMIRRNPGAVCLWVTRGFHTFGDGQGGVLLDVGDCHSCSWWAEGRPATRAEVLRSVVTGLPHLGMPSDPEAWEYLAERWVAFDGLLPEGVGDAGRV